MGTLHSSQDQKNAIEKTLLRNSITAGFIKFTNLQITLDKLFISSSASSVLLDSESPGHKTVILRRPPQLSHRV